MKRIFTLFISLFFISWIAQAQSDTQASTLTFEPVPNTQTSLKFNWTAGNSIDRLASIMLLKTDKD